MEKELLKLDLRVSKLEKDAEEFHKILEPIKEETIRQEEHYREIIRSLNELKSDVKELKDRPSKFVDYVWMCIISCVVAFLFKFIGG